MTNRYEYTPHRLKFPPFAQDDEEGEASVRKKIERLDLANNDDRWNSAFVLRNVLSPQECQWFINQAEELGMESCGYDPNIRVTDRVSAQSNKVARWLFDRIRPFLEPSIPLNQLFADDENDDKEGKEKDEDTVENLPRWPLGIPPRTRRWEWFPVGLNETFRICRYEPGGFFLPHHDGGFQRNQFEQSLQTFMLYLNDDFEGGPTRFYQESQRHYMPGQPDKVICSFQPRAGDAIIFFSSQTHDGGEVISGNKYLLRSEVMYSAYSGVAAKARDNRNNRDSAATQPRKYEPDHDEIDLDSFVPDGY